MAGLTGTTSQPRLKTNSGCNGQVGRRGPEGPLAALRLLWLDLLCPVPSLQPLWFFKDHLLIFCLPLVTFADGSRDAQLRIGSLRLVLRSPATPPRFVNSS